MNADYERGFSAGYRAALSTAERDISVDIGDTTPTRVRPMKAKRRPSAYNKQYAIEYRRLKKLHPRSKFASLTKKAHKATRRKMK